MKFQHCELMIEFSPACVTTFERYRQCSSFRSETGGQLFAAFQDNGLSIVLATRVKGASSRFTFRPNRRAEQGEIEALFLRGLHYVGDWHTHPEIAPNPSVIDENKMMDIFAKSTHGLPFMLMVIVGLDVFPAGLSVSAVTTNRIERLRPAS